MNKYAVHYQDADNDKNHIYFCRAENDTEAEQKCYEKYHDIMVIDVVEADEAPDVLFEDVKEIKTSDQVISDITEVLSQWDGKDLERIANQILSHPVKYIGDSMFESD